ncbi:MAG TPA: hypothetical protein VKO18_13025 [Terriglobia bacterium]|nr:hypothetical protein [Terriglobia bacterium]
MKIIRSNRFNSLPFFGLFCLLLFPTFGTANDAPPNLRLVGVAPSGAVEVLWAGQHAALSEGEAIGPWTLMGIIRPAKTGKPPFVVFEDFKDQMGHMLFVDTRGAFANLPKSLEPTFANPASLYRGHTLKEVMDSDHDLLGGEILAKPGDPEYDEVAACFPPLTKMRTYTFVGTHETIDKLGFEYGGRTPSFNPAPYDPQIVNIRKEGKVWDGLVGGWLPIVRFVYPQDQHNWTEMIAFAPLHIENGNDRIQPVWYRVTRVENQSVKWSRYFDSYHPYPPHLKFSAESFYADLLAMRDGWRAALRPGMKISVPDQRVADQAVNALVRDMITRVGAYPKYGVFDKNYAGSEHDGFPDTFTADTTAMLEWGLISLAGQYVDNYFDKFVRDDGSILYRGPETGQYGRMLTIVAEYANYGGDSSLLLKRRSRIDGVAKLLLSLRDQALKLPPTDPAYGLIAGWSEADSCLVPDPPREIQPYFSNSTEAERGFRDLGRVWQKIGAQTKNAELAAWGERLVRESEALHQDVQTAISRSILRDVSPPSLPAIAGAKEPFDVAFQRDQLDPQWRSYRAFMEMLYSGNLTREQVEMVYKYREARHDIILGIPIAYGYRTNELAGFLTAGHAYGLLQFDDVREYLLTLYSIMAHQYTRGTWTAPETRNIDPEHIAAPYCSPAEVTVPLMTRWMLVFEDPQSETLWLAKGTPTAWLEDDKTISVSEAPTRWGRIGYSLTSRLGQGKIEALITLPASGFAATVKLRLRVPQGNTIRSMMVNGKPWTQFDPSQGTVTLPPHLSGKITATINYR